MLLGLKCQNNTGMSQVVTHNTAGIFCQNGVGLQKACIQSLKCSEWKNEFNRQIKRNEFTRQVPILRHTYTR